MFHWNSQDFRTDSVHNSSLYIHNPARHILRYSRSNSQEPRRHNIFCCCFPCSRTGFHHRSGCISFCSGSSSMFHHIRRNKALRLWRCIFRQNICLTGTDYLSTDFLRTERRSRFFLFRMDHLYRILSDSHWNCKDEACSSIVLETLKDIDAEINFYEKEQLEITPISEP